MNVQGVVSLVAEADAVGDVLALDILTMGVAGKASVSKARRAMLIDVPNNALSRLAMAAPAVVTATASLLVLRELRELRELSTSLLKDVLVAISQFDLVAILDVLEHLLELAASVVKALTEAAEAASEQIAL